MARAPRLVLEWNGLRLRGAVASVDRGGALRVSAYAESVEIDPADALRTVLAALRRQGSTPTRCLLLTGEATAALVRLPLPPGKARPAHQMAELVRWELEPYFAQRAAAHQLGSILAGRGHLDREQVAGVVAAQQERRRQPGGRDAAAARFGAVARDLGYVTQEQLNEALGVQSRLVLETGDYTCGWSAQRGVEQDPAGGSPWLAAGMPRERRRFWCDLLGSVDLQIGCIYPLVGASIAAVGGGEDAGHNVLEIDWDLAACAFLENGAIGSLQALPLAEDESVLDLCAEMIEAAKPAPVLVSGDGAHAPSVVDALRDRSATPVELLEPPVEGVPPDAPPPHALARMAGALRHASGRAPAAAAVRIPVRDARPPIRTRPAFWWAATAAALVLAVAAGELLLASRLRRARAELEKVRGPLAAVEDARDVEQSRAAEAARLRKELEAARARSAVLAGSLECLGPDLDRRSAFLPLLLDAMARSVSPDVVLQRLAEGRPGEVRVEGWALSERAVQLFTSALQDRLGGHGLLVREQEIRSERAARRRDLYAFSFQVVPADGVED
jgi:hypothetical protein